MTKRHSISRFGIMRLHKSVGFCILLALLLSSSSITLAPDEQVPDEHFSGLWATSNLTSVVDVSQCDDSLCA